MTHSFANHDLRARPVGLAGLDEYWSWAENITTKGTKDTKKNACTAR
jgi:hypothetical protein